MRIVLAGGGTGGHITPLIAIARKLRERLGPEAELLHIGSGLQLEKELMDREGIRSKNILTGKMRRYFSFLNFLDFFRIPIGFIQSLWILLVFMPDAVFSKGGYVSVPVVLAAWCYRIPILIHESDATPGMSNQILGKLASGVVIAYPHAQSYFEASKTAFWGNPVREEMKSGNPEEGRKTFNFTESKPVVLVIGGSQGAQIINQSIIRILPKLLNRSQVIHQSGQADYEKSLHLAAEYGIKAGREGYFLSPFMESKEISQALSLADVVVSRAGATSIAEIAANGKAAILIPLENSANDHQRMNAYEIARIGGAFVLEETNLGQNFLLERIEKLLDDRELNQVMSEKIKAFYHPEAAEHIVEDIIKLANG